MKFNIGDWIVGVLKLIRDSKWLRRLLYVMFFVFGTPAVVVSVVKLIAILKG